MQQLSRETGLSRAGFYRNWQLRAPAIEGIDLRNRVQRLALEWRSYGQGRLTAALHQEGRRGAGKRMYPGLRQVNLLLCAPNLAR